MMRANGLTPAQTAAYGSNPYEAGYGYGYGVRTLLCRGTEIITALPVPLAAPAALALSARRIPRTVSASYTCII